MKQSGIYKIENRLDKKSYIGSAVNIRKRWETHRRLLTANVHPNIFLQRAWNRDGADSFSFIVLELIEDKSLLIEREQAAIEQSRSNEMAYGYNLRRHARSNLGIVPQFSEAARSAAAERMRAVGLQRGAWMQSSEGRAFMSSVQKGHKATTEQRTAMSVYRKANLNLGCFKPDHSMSLETREKISAALKGRSRSPEAIEKTAAAHRGKRISEEHKARISAANTGRRFTLESRRKMSVSRQGKSHPMPPHTEEWKRHHSEQMKGRSRPDRRQFSDDQVIEIRNLRVSGLSFGYIGKQFGVSASRIFKIVKGFVYAQPVTATERAGGGEISQ